MPSREHIAIHDVNSRVQRTRASGFCPISVKSMKNKPQGTVFPRTNRQIFLSKKNVYSMIYYIVSLNLKNRTNPLWKPNIGLKKQLDAMQKEIPIMMVDWADQQGIDDFEDLNDNILVTLEFLNKKFIINHSRMYDRAGRSDLNVFHTLGRVTDSGNKEYMKHYDEMLATDYHTLDLWQPLKIDTYDKANRYCNKFPVWQTSMNIRELDRSNDGLHAAESKRASLNNQVHGYDMSNIVKGSTFYDNYYYENI
jgi:hypothetical protein